MIKQINFNVGCTIFDIKLRKQLVLVMGKSGVGKSFFFNSFKNYILANGKENMVYFYNFADVGNRDYMYDRIRKSKNKLFVIDNADLLISKKMKQIISKDCNNQYLIFTRNIEGYTYCKDNIASMRVAEDTIYLDYILNRGGK